MVINLDLPTYKEGKADCESYHDCIGREALFGPSRVAINLVEGDDPQSMSVLKQIEKHFGKLLKLIILYLCIYGAPLI